MFIKWVLSYLRMLIKDVYTEYRLNSSFRVGVQRTFIYWTILVVVITIVSLSSKSETVGDIFLRTYIVPFAIITIVPVYVILIGYKLYRFLVVVHNDYSYFVANGGKLKREQLRKNDEVDENQEWIHSSDISTESTNQDGIPESEELNDSDSAFYLGGLPSAIGKQDNKS